MCTNALTESVTQCYMRVERVGIACFGNKNGQRRYVYLVLGRASYEADYIQEIF